MSTLSLLEWSNWHIPSVTLVVVTNDRPKSLSRTLDSLKTALYFGDRPSIHLNLEQTADSSTLSLANSFTWPHGDSYMRHRVIKGGLLSAVVESWYPAGNHSHGVIIEDDVELSPMFYAWLKMTLLRYRYGLDKNVSPRLFGISLYQQKTLELSLSGRRPFSARDLFSKLRLPDPGTPYVSQIPCSWGALFFPEHWREFHDYLVLRLSEATHDISDVIVPDVRSNFWRRSWKKYLIELIYLRGYLMLYPNYPDFMSLSTNHLEIGSHVKEESKEVYLAKKALFTVPLMPLPGLSLTGVDILDLPNANLPDWENLPILDLLGLPTTELDIARIAYERRLEVSSCEWRHSNAYTYDARELLCVGVYEGTHD
ncbi:hypothetical protein SISNIDRAFT_503355 [Sistotremastrum niveocremeum HHB9708]|nr:hypothetical protein SISNIDRAFT_503355 [Sistotremastrum niveocremeum HHB9708]